MSKVGKSIMQEIQFPDFLIKFLLMNKLWRPGFGIQDAQVGENVYLL
jgi:hypothetical protein